VIDHGSPRRIIFTGDLGQWDRPIVCNPTTFTEADYIVMESTYGNRVHENHESIESQLEKVIAETVAQGARSSFHLRHRAGTGLIYYLGRLLHAGRIPEIPVFSIVRWRPT